MAELTQDSDHLTAAELEAAALGRPRADSREHLDLCDRCRDEVESLRGWNREAAILRMAQPSGPGPDCPSPAILASLAAGLRLPESDWLLEHAASCDHCGAILMAATGTDENPLAATLRTATPEWQTWTSAHCLKQARAARGRWVYRHWWVGAAGILIATAAAGLWWQHRANDPARLLADAYTLARPFDYRLPDAGYGPVRQRRSASISTFDRPASLGKAEEAIQRRLPRDEARPDVMLLKGRAELIEGQYEPAIDDLTRASELAPSADALADLGAAYEVRGDAERRNSDYGQAIELLLRAQRLDPGHRNALFNLAIAYEKVSMLDAAAAAWNKLIPLEPTKEWAAEAQRRLLGVEKKRAARKAALDTIPDDPKAFLVVLRSRAANYDAENLQTAFWSRWLPAAQQDPSADEAARRLAADWVTRFGDHSLRDAYEQAARPGAAPLLARAGATIRNNFHGHNDEVLAETPDLIARLRAAGQKVAAERMEIELAYSWRRSTQHQPCLVIAADLLGELDETRDPWLAGRTHLENSVCMNRNAGMGPARREREETQRAASARGLAGLALQAEELVTSIDRLSGDSAAVWEKSPPALAAYWNSADPESRAQQALYDMAFAAKGLGWKEAAIAAQTEAVRALSRWDEPEVEAVSRVYLATLFQDAGYPREAGAELDAADGLFRRLPPGATVVNMMLDGQLRKAEVDAAGPMPDKALRELDSLLNRPVLSSLEVRMRAGQARGIAFATRGDWRDAERCFREATGLAGEHVRSFSQPLARIAAAEMALDSRRNLVRIALANESDAPAALRAWEDRWADLTPDRPAAAWASKAAWTSDDVALIYTIVPAGVAAFVAGRSGVRGLLLPVRPDTLEAEARAFHRMCASPKSDPDVLRTQGAKLYRSLIGPFDNEISAARNVLIESDQWLSALPFAALTDGAGRYFAERHAVATVSSLADANEPPGRGFTRDTSAVIVAAPGAGPAAGLPFLPGAALEAEDLAARLVRPALLESPAEPQAAIARRMAAAELVHFAGHGWSNGGNAALVLGPDAQGGGRYLTATDLAALDWKSCRLAVLSACLTAAGEERGPVNPQSLVRALLAAGARRVVASRWSIDGESTAALMHSFYDALFAGDAPAPALSTAESRIRTTRGWEHPYYWAAFDVFGAP
jgi:CHAT domain-containing protein